MTAYQEFICDADIEKGKIRLWELEINGAIDNLLDFCRDFLSQKGFSYTGYQIDQYGTPKAVFNNRFIWDGAIQEGNRVAIRIRQM